jgi:signal transduction histidine kinase
MRQPRTQAFEKILKGSQRAAVLVNSMLGFARHHQTQPVPTDLAQLVDEALLLTEKDLVKHRVQVEKRFYDRPIAPVVPVRSSRFWSTSSSMPVKRCPTAVACGSKSARTQPPRWPRFALAIPAWASRPINCA